jgi:hypothetical protein
LHICFPHKAIISMDNTMLPNNKMGNHHCATCL